MSYARHILGTGRSTPELDSDVLAATVDALNDCAQACAAEVSDDLGGRDVPEMVDCILLCLDCVDVCTATMGIVSRQTAYDGNAMTSLLEACASICGNCGDECERHAEMHAHCRMCAEACRRCEQACRQLIDATKLPTAAAPAGQDGRRSQVVSGTAGFAVR